MTYSAQVTQKYGHHYGPGLHGGHTWPYGLEGVNVYKMAKFHLGDLVGDFECQILSRIH